jgi:RNA polymerase-binding protein DksA
MDKKFLEARKQDLLKRRDEIIKQLDSFAKKTRLGSDDYQAKWTEFGDKEDENAAEVEVFERDLSLEDTLEVSLQKINLALKKIENGTYGACDKCGKPIEEGRLEVFPSANACMSCKRLGL